MSKNVPEPCSLDHVVEFGGFICTAYFKEPGCAYSEELEETVMALQSDKDRDVRFFASLDPNKSLMNTAPLI